jgi:3D-(3,5/4)-trihydroxycyclohexane-1,2-dione acylhydrolase (decyclizing)
VLTDPAECGPVTLAFCQDVQTEAADYPQHFFAPRVWRRRRIRPDQRDLAEAASLLRAASRPLVIAGGGVLYSDAEAALARFAAAHGLPVAETQAGKSSLPASHPMNMGGIGVTGTGAANALAAEADLILAIGTRLQDFTTGSRALFAAAGRRIVGLNVQLFDAAKHAGVPLLTDALAGLEGLEAALAGWQAPTAWTSRAQQEKAAWEELAARYTAPGNAPLPSDAQVIGAVQRQLRPGDVVLNAAGGLPGELHKLFRAEEALGYHMEYGFSCMGYEIAGGIGTKLALPGRNVIVLVGDGSYLMLNSELATSILLGQKLTVVILDNHGFGCINRLQQATGGEPFNNLFPETLHAELPVLDFAAHARSLGAIAERVGTIAELETALVRARASTRTHVIVVETDAAASTDAGGAWWDVAVPEVSPRKQVASARARYERATTRRAAIE